jgi:hypothetical protein
MIPPFEDNGYLPPGVHFATLDEVEVRFGQGSELRRVTDALEPNDIDCVILVGPEFPREPAVEIELKQGLPFIDLHVVGDEDLDLFIGTVFGTDRFTVPKRVVAILL